MQYQNYNYGQVKGGATSDSGASAVSNGVERVKSPIEYEEVNQDTNRNTQRMPTKRSAVKKTQKKALSQAKPVTYKQYRDL